LREAQNGEITQIAQRQHFPKENCESPSRNCKPPARTIPHPFTYLVQTTGAKSRNNPMAHHKGHVACGSGKIEASYGISA
jgi:hypothetical protein